MLPRPITNFVIQSYYLDVFGEKNEKYTHLLMSLMSLFECHLADMELISRFNKIICFFVMCYLYL